MFGGGFGALDIFLIAFVVIGILVFALFKLNRWAAKKSGEQQTMIDQTKQVATIYVIDKQRAKIMEANVPKIVHENVPRMYRYMKMPLVKAKVGPQIVTLICDKKVFKVLPVKKNVKVELAGIYIVSMKGAAPAGARKK